MIISWVMIISLAIYCFSRIFTRGFGEGAREERKKVLKNKELLE